MRNAGSRSRPPRRQLRRLLQHLARPPTAQLVSTRFPFGPGAPLPPARTPGAAARLARGRRVRH
eukprot:2762169-Alexandrium_andersonii.AAC.1